MIALQLEISRRTVVIDVLVSVELLGRTPLMTSGAWSSNDTYNEGITLSSKDLKVVYGERLNVLPVDFDDSQVVAVNGENEIGIA